MSHQVDRYSLAESIFQEPFSEARERFRFAPPSHPALFTRGCFELTSSRVLTSRMRSRVSNHERR